MNEQQRALLRDSLLSELICGNTNTSRESVVRNAEKLAGGDPDKFLGFEFEGLTPQSVMNDVAQVCGCSTSLEERTGPGFIDVELTLDALALASNRLRKAARGNERVLLATGHPTGLMSMYMGIARALNQSGCKLLTPRSGERLVPVAERGKGNRIRYLDSVAAFTNGADLYHTHESWPMDRLLESIEKPDLVIADHGFAGSAISKGIDTIAFTDVNDPALCVAAARGLAPIVVPLDDNREPERYLAMATYLFDAAASKSAH